MTHEQIAIIALLIAQALSIYAIWLTQQTGEWFRKAWLRDATELLHWKRNALMRDPKTGRYKRKGDF